MAEILYFGRVSDVSGMDQEQLDLPTHIATTGDLRTWLDQRFEAGGALLEPSIRFAVNSEFVFDTHPIQTSDEIAIMPPVGGG